MSDKKEEKISPEELNKMEEEAYYELCQIIAEAMQYQDIELLDYRIAAWKKKYKKLLDSPLAGQKFKRRIEYLLNEYYSSITLYIWQQIKKQEQKKIDKQYKAMRRLYKIIDETNDLKTLKKEVSKWEEKYPPDSFLQMYQKKIKRLTSEKNLKENAFDQDKAFYDLYRITKKTGTLDELKEEVTKWKKTYRIDSQFKIDDFIKNQSDVKRYTSEDYLDSIAKHDEKVEDTQKNKEENSEEESTLNTQLIDSQPIEQENKNQYSDLGKQARAYSSLIVIAKSPNNIDKMLNWVHKNSSIKFNDEYKALILSATYLEYSPKYLNSLKTPNIDILKTNLSLDDFKKINDIKRYAIISYFNTLLPKSQAMSNNFFNNYIKDIYFRTKNTKLKAKVSVKDKAENKGKEKTSNIQIEEDTDSIETKTTSPHSNEIESIKLNTEIPNAIEDRGVTFTVSETTSSEIELDDLEKTSIYQFDFNNSNIEAQTYSTSEGKIEDDPMEIQVDESENNVEPEVITVSEVISLEDDTEPKTNIETDNQEAKTNNISEIKTENSSQKTKVEIIEKEESKEQISNDSTNANQEIKPEQNETKTNSEIKTENIPQQQESPSKLKIKIKKKLQEPEDNKTIKKEEKAQEPEDSKTSKTDEKVQEQKTSEIKTIKIEKDEKTTGPKAIKKEPEIKQEETEIDDFDVNTYSHLFYDQIYNYSVQAEIIEKIDDSVKEYEEVIEQEISSDDMLVQKNKIDN